MSIGMKAVTMSGTLIGIYLIMAHATGAGNLLARAGTAGSGVVKALQGR